MNDFPKSNPPHPTTGRSSETLAESSTSNWRIHMRTPAWRPPTDFYETEEMLVVRVEIPGMRDEGFMIELTGRSLTIRGTRQDVPERRAFHQMEIRFGEFIIELELPQAVEADQVKAVYTDGFLRVYLPKSRPRQIPILE